MIISNALAFAGAFWFWEKYLLFSFFVALFYKSFVINPMWIFLKGLLARVINFSFGSFFHDYSFLGRATASQLLTAIEVKL